MNNRPKNLKPSLFNLSSFSQSTRPLTVQNQSVPIAHGYGLRSSRNIPIRLDNSISTRHDQIRHGSHERSRSIPIITHDHHHVINGNTIHQHNPNEDTVGIRPNDNETYTGNVRIESVDVLSSENGSAHHTDKYDLVQDGGLVVRRGQSFNLLIHFDGKYSRKRNTIRFVFKAGSNPKPGTGSHIQCILNTEYRPSSIREWTAILKNRPSKDKALVSITPPADCIVADWRMAVENILPQSNGSRAHKYSHPQPIFILFNPWCPDDAVYMPKSELLKEYILNDSGVIFNNTFKNIGTKPWFYGQFEENVLEAALYCVKRGFNSQVGHAMSDPVRVCRAISKMINSNDDNGVLSGKWNKPYSGGKSPTAWNGSVAILRQYLKTESPVRWGQCFVFAGVVTTVCRALGIPCRTVTNFRSAHDTDANVKIDIYFDRNRKEQVAGPNGKRDSIWNFHCWNDVWMARNDLPQGYGGWQIIDATPQETSGGVSQCGPASLRAVKEGRVELLYDTPFVFAEVNADKISWTRDMNGRWCISNVDPVAVGKFISTKVADGNPVDAYGRRSGNIRSDITDEYKYPDESERGRISVMAASRSRIDSKPSIHGKTILYGYVQSREHGYNVPGKRPPDLCK